MFYIILKRITHIVCIYVLIVTHQPPGWYDAIEQRGKGKYDRAGLRTELMNKRLSIIGFIVIVNLTVLSSDILGRWMGEIFWHGI